MRTLNLAIIMYALAAVPVACSPAVPQPAAVSLPTLPPGPTATFTLAASPPLPPTHTPTAADSPTPELTPPASQRLPLPTGEPADEWEGIPIMPEAIAGIEAEGDYWYSVKAAPQEIQAFYEEAMPTAGWQPFATSTSETGNLLIMYTKDDRMVAISAIVQGDVTLVLIVFT
jgi:hypothetical protein